MDIVVTGRHCTVSPDLKDLVTDRISSVERLRDRVIRVEVEFTADVASGRVSSFQVVNDVRGPLPGFGIGIDHGWPAADADGRPLEGTADDIFYTLDGATRVRWLSGSFSGPDPVTALIDAGARPFTQETFPVSGFAFKCMRVFFGMFCRYCCCLCLFVVISAPLGSS